MAPVRFVGVSFSRFRESELPWKIAGASREFIMRSEILEFSLLDLNPLLMQSNIKTSMSHKRRAASVGDSVSSRLSAVAVDTKKSYEMGQLIESDVHVDTKETKTKDNEIDKQHNEGRSWSGSPDWDFKEGCSYDVQNYRTYGALEYIKRSTQGTPPQTPVQLSKTIPNRETRTPDDPFHATLHNKLINQLSLEDALLLDSARDVQSADEPVWDVSPPNSTLYSSARSVSSDISISSSASHRHAKSDTAMEETSIDAMSFLQKVRNELDIDLLECDDEEKISEASEDDVAALEAASSNSGLQDDPTDRTPKSGIGNVLNLVVGIGACAIFQFLK